jgi:molybdopterin/thiamine biosynthesis adenylyltransferase
MGLLKDQPQRMAREKRGIEELARAEKWLSLGTWTASANGLQLSFHLPTFEFDGLLVYPPLFPKVPAYVRPTVNGDWSQHQYGNGVLCLERGPDNWDPSVTGAELLRSAYDLIFSEAIRAFVPTAAAAPSRHHLTLGQSVRTERRRFVYSSDIDLRLNGMQTGQAWRLKVATNWLEDVAVTRPVAVGLDEPVALKGPTLPEIALYEDGWAFLAATSVFRMDATLEAVAALGASCGVSLDELKSKGILVRDAEGGIRAFRISDAFVMTELGIVDARTNDHDRLPPEFARLKALRVAVVGAGSLGSKIAVSLARSGVRMFSLIDADVLMPQNLARNELDGPAIGFAKVDSLAERIKRVAAESAVFTFRFEVGGQENPEVAARLAEVIDNSDLVIDATASAEAFVALAALCGNKVAVVWGEIFAGGIGAMMARSRPGRDAEPLAIRAHIYGVMDTMAEAPRVKSKRYGLATEGVTLVAGDAEVSALAASMTAFAIDAACREESDYPAGAYLIGFKKFWEFRAPFDTIPIDCPPPAAAEEPPVLTADEAAALGELADAVLETVGATSNAAS